jgi:hypothetical protein
MKKKIYSTRGTVSFSRHQRRNRWRGRAHIDVIRRVKGNVQPLTDTQTQPVAQRFGRARGR